MATVQDLARIGDPLDQRRADPNRKVAGTPIALALTPQYSGEIILNTLTGDLWYAKGVTVSDWTPAVVSV